MPESAESPAGNKALPWAAIAWFGTLLILTYFPILKHLVEQWSYDDDVGHGFFVPLVSGYIVWTRRAELAAIEWKPAWWGLWLMGWAAVQAYIGLLGAELFLQRTAFMISLVGLLLVLGGKKLVSELGFPLVLLLFMIPLPTVVYNRITFPLQLFASQVAELALGAIGIPVLREGNVLELASQKLSVAEACSGIRSLLSLSFLSLVYAYFFDSKIWMRWALLLSVLPIAILANAGRVTITGVLSEHNPELARGFFHEVEGFIIFAIAFAMLFVLHMLINGIYRWKSAKEAHAA
ncbi:MAG TPA: exosortase/archaeosortase family protein [Bryobacteraceae bacterium]|nr:exosortase/archaeosortase family protein [Bryobacteraceae bacterium]